MSEWKIMYKSSDEFAENIGLIRSMFRIPFSTDIEAIGISDSHVKVKDKHGWVFYSRLGVK